jgi:RecB family exonuclease
MFAACAYRYFLRNVQRLREWEEPDRAAELDPRALGITFHDAARRVVEAAIAWPPTADEAEELASVCAEQALTRHEHENAPIVPGLMRDISRRRLEALLRIWLRHEAGRRDGLRPAGAEVALGSREAPFVLDAGGFPVRFTGSIDRVDEDRDRQAARVIDYKVKLAPGFKKSFGDGRIAGGEAVQLPLYSLAVGGNVSSEYLVLQAGNADAPAIEPVTFTLDETREAIGHFRTLLAGMEAAVASGTFTPRVETRLRRDPCTFCECADVCGPGHDERYRGKDGDPAPEARALRALRELP